MQGMPTVTDGHRKLHVFAGEWIGDETLADSPWGPGGPARGKSTGRVVCDGFWVANDYEQECGGKVTFRGHGVFGYDAEKEQYVWWWVDSMGMVPQPVWGTWKGNTLTFLAAAPQGEGRFTYVFDGPDHYTFKIENSFDGGKTWNAFMTSAYRRA
jgi:hypothetical protein